MERERVTVVTDSAASLPQEVASELAIEVVPIYLTFGDRQHRDTEAIDGFYERLRRERRPATTAAPSPGDFLDAFRRAGGAVTCVTVAASVSASHRSAEVAAGEHEGRVEVVDSGSAAMGQGFVALEAARVAAGGASLEEVAARARDVAGRVRLLAMIDTFEFLRRSGRVGRVTSMAATAVGVKPIFRMAGGDIGAVARPRTRRRAEARIAADARADIGDRPVHLAALHAAAPDRARTLLDRVAEGLEVVESHVASFTPAMGAHTGPGLVGLAWFCD